MASSWPLAKPAFSWPSLPSWLHLALLVQLAFSWSCFSSWPLVGPAFQAGLQLVLLALLAYVWAIPNQGGLQLALLIQLANGWPFWLTQVAPLKAMPTYTLLEFATVTLEARPNGVGAPKNNVRFKSFHSYIFLVYLLLPLYTQTCG